MSDRVLAVGHVESRCLESLAGVCDRTRRRSRGRVGRARSRREGRLGSRGRARTRRPAARTRSTPGSRPGRGRPAARPSEYDITAPCENPARTVRSGGTPASASDGVQPGRGALEREREERLRVRDSRPVGRCTSARRRAGERAARGARTPTSRRSGSRMSSERIEVVLVRAAAVQEDEGTRRLAVSGPGVIRQRSGAHVA